MKVSVVATTYNRPRALDAVLASLAAQRRPADEVLVADDGSTSETRDVVEAWRARGLPLVHVWQPDQGFRAGMIRNRAIARARGELVIFIDGDCLAFPDFVERHARLAEPGRFLAGSRALLSPALTEAVEAKRDDPLEWGAARWLQARMRGEVNRLLPLLRLSDGAWRCKPASKWELARTCNLACWRADLERVNGFDERFDGWGFEDSDLAVRLIRAGVSLKSGRFATTVLHLWHRENDRSQAMRNHALLQETLAGRATRAARGLDTHREDAGGAAGA